MGPFLISVQKRLFKEALQSKLGQSLTNHQGVNTLKQKSKRLLKLIKSKKGF